MSLLVVGSVAYDALESPYGKVDRTLGGAATYFAVAARFFTPVSLVAIEATISAPRMKPSFAAARLTSKASSGAPGKCFFWPGPLLRKSE